MCVGFMSYSMGGFIGNFERTFMMWNTVHRSKVAKDEHIGLRYEMNVQSRRLP